MAILTELLGPPALQSICDQSWYCSGWGYGLCGYIHVAEWPEEDLSILVADCEHEADALETPRLIGWTVQERWGEEEASMLRTPEGVGPGSTLGELQAAYGDRLEVYHDGDHGGLSFTITDPHGVDSGTLYGDLERPPGFEFPDDHGGNSEDLMLRLDPSTKVTGFGAGVGQDNC